MKTWKYQRYSAVLIAPLLIWLVVSLGNLPSYHYDDLIMWLSQSHVVVFVNVLIIGISVHAYIGIEDVFLDYIHKSKIAVAMNTLKAVILITLVAGLLSVNSIALSH